MTKETNKPTHRLVKYYGTGKNAPSAEVGAIWTKEDGNLYIQINTMQGQISLNGFKIEAQQ